MGIIYNKLKRQRKDKERKILRTHIASMLLDTLVSNGFNWDAPDDKNRMVEISVELTDKLIERLKI